MFHTAQDGTRFRDLNHNGVLDPYEDPRLSVEERVDDLVPRLSLEELCGLLFHTVIEAGPGGALLDGAGRISKTGARVTVLAKGLNHFNVHFLPDGRTAARWQNNLQALAEETPHGIPVTISTDPRHGAETNAGTFWSTPFFSHWPAGLGLAALGDPALARVFGDVVRRDYVAVGIRAALHPTADLATEPRWGRQVETLGADAGQVSTLVTAILAGLQGERLRPGSVAATTKHFPGGGPQADGEDAHFPYGKDQVYPGGRFAEHLEPFRAAIAAGTAAIMPYYGRPIGLELDGEPIEPVGFGYNRQIVTGLLRERLGYRGVVLSDWELVNDNLVGHQVLPARAWGVEHLTPAERMLKLLDAGIDQFGGEECTDVLADLVRSGRVPRARLEESARRLLAVKFALGLFDDPYVDEDAAALLPLADDVALGHRTQARSTVVLADAGLLPLVPGRRIYAEGLSDAEVVGVGQRVERPEDAEVGLIRLQAPYDARDDLFLEAFFRQGSLDFPPGLPVRLARIAAHCPLIVDVHLDRPAILTPLVGVAATLTATFGVSNAAWLDAITGRIPPEGRLPVELPRSMAAVRESREDVANDTADPLFPVGHGLTIQEVRP